MLRGCAKGGGSGVMLDFFTNEVVPKVVEVVPKVLRGCAKGGGCCAGGCAECA